MILDQIAWIDIAIFLIFLIPQLLIHVGFVGTVACGLKALPHLLFQLPYQLIQERYFAKQENKSPFVQDATLFQDLVIRCVRYAFAQIPASIGKVFFSKWVALPFMRFRMLRNGFFRSPLQWQEVSNDGMRGVYMIEDPDRRPDIVVLYCHGGGFSMGSSFFYMEFLFAWLDLLLDSGYSNPALLAVEYTLVPEATYPTQVQQALAGYKYALSKVESSTQICVSGDSAGATLILSLLLCLSDFSSLKRQMPGLAILISPWVTILSAYNKNTPSDYLDAASLERYGKQYIGATASPNDPMVSPGCCKDLSWWRRASPAKGWYFLYGAEEVFAPETRELIGTLEKANMKVGALEEANWVHAWPVVRMFLSRSKEERLKGLRAMVKVMVERVPPKKVT